MSAELPQTALTTRIHHFFDGQRPFYEMGKDQFDAVMQQIRNFKERAEKEDEEAEKDTEDEMFDMAIDVLDMEISQQIEELSKQIQENNEEIARIRAEMEPLQAERQTLVGRLAEIAIEIPQLEARHAEIPKLIQAVQEKLATNTQALQENAQDIEATQKELDLNTSIKDMEKPLDEAIATIKDQVTDGTLSQEDAQYSEAQLNYAKAMDNGKGRIYMRRLLNGENLNAGEQRFANDIQTQIDAIATKDGISQQEAKHKFLQDIRKSSKDIHGIRCGAAEKIPHLQKKLSKFSLQRESLISQRDGLNSKIEALQKEGGDIEDKLKTLRQEQEVINEKIEHIDKRLNRMEGRIEELKTENEAAESKKAELEKAKPEKQQSTAGLKKEFDKSVQLVQKVDDPNAGAANDANYDIAPEVKQVAPADTTAANDSPSALAKPA